MSDRWNCLLSEALNRHDGILKWIAGRADGFHRDFGQRSIEDLKISFGTIKEEVGNECERFNKEIARIISWENDSPVWVRNYGANRRYHGSPHCGWLSPIGQRVEEMLLGEAEAAGIPPCISCGQHAVRAYPHAA